MLARILLKRNCRRGRRANRENETEKKTMKTNLLIGEMESVNRIMDYWEQVGHHDAKMGKKLDVRWLVDTSEDQFCLMALGFPRKLAKNLCIEAYEYGYELYEHGGDCIAMINERAKKQSITG